MKTDLINKIVEIEWDMFTRVSNIGGTASCQRDPKTFRIMRSSQFISYSKDVLDSYLKDLETAKKEGRNLMTEKYARMMEYTSPSEYSRIAHLIQPVEKKKINLINKIIKNILDWEKNLLNRFPFLYKKGRPAYSDEDKKNITSIETYLRGELSTYSNQTLSLYNMYIQEQKAKNINASEIVLLNMVKAYGYRSLEEAENKLKGIDV